MSDFLADCPPLAAVIERLAQARFVFFAGLPGTGKSLLLNRLAHAGHGAGRVVHLLQWDVARPAFETHPAARRHAPTGGVTHVVIRRAVGLWVRDALVAWHHAHASPEHLLIGETPFVGNRFIELARRADDAAEALLRSEDCRFVLPIPSRTVRAFLEAERERRTTRPMHPRETEDAPPAVLRALWRELAGIGRSVGLGDGGDAYDPGVYRAVYERVLVHRRVDAIAVETVLPTGGRSVYDFSVPCRDLVPAAGEAETWIAEVERRYPDLATLDREVARWWQV